MSCPEDRAVPYDINEKVWKRARGVAYVPSPSNGRMAPSDKMFESMNDVEVLTRKLKDVEMRLEQSKLQSKRLWAACQAMASNMRKEDFTQTKKF